MTSPNGRTDWRSDLFRADALAALLGGLALLACAILALLNRYDLYLDAITHALFWDSHVMTAAGDLVAKGVSPYAEPVIDQPYLLPFISAPQVAVFFGGLSMLLGPIVLSLMQASHVVALVLIPLMFARAWIGRSWQDAALAYGLLACGLGAFGVTTIIAGNMGATLYLFIFAGMFRGLRDEKWLAFHIAIAIAVQVKFPYAALWAIPVMANGWSWRRLRNGAIAAACALIPFAVAYLADGAYFAEWIDSLARQVDGAHDVGYTFYGAMINTLQTGATSSAPIIVQLAVAAGLFVFLLLDRTRDWRRIAALIVFVILINPRMKEYDVAFAALPVAALHIAAIAPAGSSALRRALAIAAVVIVSIGLLRADHVPYLGAFMMPIVAASSILTLALRRPAPAQPGVPGLWDNIRPLLRRRPAPGPAAG